MTVSFMNQSGFRVRPTYIEERGDQIADWTNPELTPITGVRLQPEAGQELLVRRDGWIAAAVLYAPLGHGITVHDRYRQNGVDYDVLDVRDWISPSGLAAHSEIKLRRVEG